MALGVDQSSRWIAVGGEDVPHALAAGDVGTLVACRVEIAGGDQQVERVKGSGDNAQQGAAGDSFRQVDRLDTRGGPRSGDDRGRHLARG
jgi:hypothetical protein